MAEEAQHGGHLSHDEIAKYGWKQLAARWIYEQSLPTVILLMLIGSMSYTVYHVVHDIVPQHLTQIQGGYDRLATSHEKVVKEIVESHERDRQIFVELFQLERRKNEQRKPSE